MRPRLRRCGDCALLIEFGDRIQPRIQNRIRAFEARLRRPDVALPGLLETLPSYAALLLCFAPGALDDGTVEARVEALLRAPTLLSGWTRPARTLRLPVLYGGDAGPDLADVAEHARLSPERVIALHARPRYRVYMLGFTPGFPYLGGLNRRLETPRLKSPRLSIPAGSVGIAGGQTGVYPVASPGGWRLIGRTPLKLYDPAREAPFLLEAGDNLRFIPIDEGRFERIERGAEAWALSSNWAAF